MESEQSGTHGKLHSLLAIICGLSLIFISSTARAQSRASTANPQEQRLKSLEERLASLEQEIGSLKQELQAARTTSSSASGEPRLILASAAVLQPAAPQVAAPAPQSPVAGQGDQQGTPSTLPNYGGASAMSKVLNPDISVIGNFVGAAGGNPVNPSPALQMRESEVGLQAIVDPFAKADFFLSFGEHNVDLEEGYITFTALPAGFIAKAGKFRADFGKVNTLHDHVLPWTDRPLVTESLLGGDEGITDAGLSISRILPAPRGIFLEGTAQLLRGDSADVFTSSRRSNVSTVEHLRAYRDLTDSTNIDLGYSFARGHNDAGSSFTTLLNGVDATFHWTPLRRTIYHNFVGRAEWIWSDRNQLNPTLTLVQKQRASGMYASGDYRLNRRWTVGGRFDRSERARDASFVDKGFSTILTYWPSEFSQIRGQYRFTRYAGNLDASELLFQFQFSLGAHGAHPF